jgi:hypothetical protein
VQYDFITEIIDLLVTHGDNTTLTQVIDKVESEIIRRRGYQDGRHAGSWMIDGNTSEQTLRTYKKLMDDGDPELMDTLPAPRLGGEFADDPTWEQILKDEGIRYDSEVDSDGRQELEDIYRTAFDEGVQDQMSKTIKVVLGDDS